MKKPEKVKNHLDIARRLGESFDLLQDAPTKNHGQLGWIVDRVSERTGETVAQETVRKWLSGESRPLKKYMEALADILGVSSGWLDYGIIGQDVKEISQTQEPSKPAQISRPAPGIDQMTIKISRGDLKKLEEIGKGLFTPSEIISRLLNNLG